MDDKTVVKDIVDNYLKSISQLQSEVEVLKKSEHFIEWLKWLNNKHIISDKEFNHSLNEMNVFVSSQITRLNKIGKKSLTFNKVIIYICSVILFFGIIFYYLTNVYKSDEISYSQNKVLPYQGKLLNKEGRPITSKTDISFRLYTSLNEKNPFYVGSCTGVNGIIPNYIGEFTVVLGSDCNMPGIDSKHFDNRDDVFLGVQIGSESELSPRQKVSTTGYSTDAAMLQGLELGTKPRTIPFINGSGDIHIDNATGGIRALEGEFSIESQSLIFKTLDSHKGSILFQPGAGANTIIGTGRLGIGTFKPSQLLSIEGVEPYSGIATIKNLSTIDDEATSVLKLSVGTTKEGTQSKFINFYAGGNSEIDGEAVGNISLNNEGVSYETAGADFAEYFDVADSDNIIPGTIMTISNRGIHKSKRGEQIIGIVSDTPGFVGNKKDSINNQVLIGLVGQIETNVNNTNGDIDIGDKVVLSDIEGYGAKNNLNENEIVVGYALEKFNNSNYETCSSEVLSRHGDQSLKCGRIVILIR